MKQQIDYKQMSMILLAVSEALQAALKHKGLEADDITFAMTDAQGKVVNKTTTVDAVIDACRIGLDLPKQTITTTEHEV